MNRKILIITVIILSLTTILVGYVTLFGQSENNYTTIRLATTTSTKDSGLLDYVLPAFEKKCGVNVEVIAQGTGQAIKTASMGDADVILVHARSAEEKFVADGHGVERFDVMYNDFVIIGPKEDPAGIKGKAINEALISLTNGEAPFISRGDDSGTNKKELALWKEVSINPEGDWYLSVGKGMGETLIMTNEQQGYTLTDRATFTFMKDKLDLEVLVEGDKKLLNPYSIIAVNPDKHESINSEGAQKLIDFLLSEQGQQMIKDYKVKGNQLFFNDN